MGLLDSLAARVADGQPSLLNFVGEPQLPQQYRHLQPGQPDQPRQGYTLPKSFEGWGDDRDALFKRFLFQGDGSGNLNLAPGTRDGGLLGPFPPDDRMREINPDLAPSLPFGFMLRR